MVRHGRLDARLQGIHGSADLVVIRTRRAHQDEAVAVLRWETVPLGSSSDAGPVLRSGAGSGEDLLEDRSSLVGVGGGELHLDAEVALCDGGDGVVQPRSSRSANSSTTACSTPSPLRMATSQMAQLSER